MSIPQTGRSLLPTHKTARWYDTEHMPGLTRVPGGVPASRFLNLDQCSASIPFFDLETTEILGSESWLWMRNLMEQPRPAAFDQLAAHGVHVARAEFSIVMLYK